MIDRHTPAERHYEALVRGKFGLRQVNACAPSKVNKIDSFPAFTFFLVDVVFKELLINTVDRIVSVKTHRWAGIVWGSSAGSSLDDARKVCWPIAEQVGRLIDGSVVDYQGTPYFQVEMVGPSHTTDEGAMDVEVGKYAWMISWEYNMQYTQSRS